jgi:GR25 family glycosyltransferase involved in LPS biosynthesis
MEFNKNNTFCISLMSNTDRWSRCESRFNILGLEVTRWPAACCEEDFISPIAPYLNTGQKGCSQSHINIWNHIIEKGLEYALVLEDDACFDKSWREKIDLFCMMNEDQEWHAVFLNASEPIIPHDTWVKCYEQYLTAGYIISLAGAKQLISDFGNCFYSSDWMTSRLQYHNHCYCYFPWLIIQEGKDSTIGQNLEADHAKVVRCLEEIDYSLSDNYVI